MDAEMNDHDVVWTGSKLDDDVTHLRVVGRRQTLCGAPVPDDAIAVGGHWSEATCLECFGARAGEPLGLVGDS